jgi:hypothetical protein
MICSETVGQRGEVSESSGSITFDEGCPDSGVLLTGRLEVLHAENKTV